MTNDKYDFDKEVNITLSQAKMAILMEICTKIARFGLAPEEEHVLREIESQPSRRSTSSSTRTTSR